jgi:hypothetical protein
MRGIKEWETQRERERPEGNWIRREEGGKIVGGKEEGIDDVIITREREERVGGEGYLEVHRRGHASVHGH